MHLTQNSCRRNRRRSFVPTYNMFGVCLPINDPQTFFVLFLEAVFSIILFSLSTVRCTAKPINAHWSISIGSVTNEPLLSSTKDKYCLSHNQRYSEYFFTNTQAIIICTYTVDKRGWFSVKFETIYKESLNFADCSTRSDSEHIYKRVKTYVGKSENNLPLCWGICKGTTTHICYISNNLHYFSP